MQLCGKKLNHKVLKTSETKFLIIRILQRIVLKSYTKVRSKHYYR